MKDGDSVVQEILVQRLRQGSEAAARCLVGHTVPDSDDDLDSRLLALDGSFYSIRPFMAAVGRMRTEPEFAARISARATRLGDLGKGSPVLDLVRGALVEPEKWDAAIWRIVGGGERVLGVQDDDVQVLLRIGRTYSDLRAPLSAAVTRLLTDTSLTSRNIRARQWLLLLSNEFGTHSLPTLEEALRLHSVNDDRLRAALVARFLALGGSLDRVPITRPDGAASVPTHWRAQAAASVSKPDVAAWIAKRVWDSEGLDEQFLLVLEQLFAYSSFAPSEIGNLGAAGDEGTLIAAIVAACFGYVDKGMAPVLILKKEPFPRRRRDESTTYQLFRGWNAYLAMTASDDAARTRYLRAVDAAFGDPEFDRPLLLSVLHELGQPASLQQLVAIITEWPNAQISNDSLVLDAIASALSDAAVADQERRALQTAIHAALGQFAAFGDQWGRSSALRQVGLPLLQWSFGAKEHDAMAFEVFSQGFVSLFKAGDVTDVEGTFEALAPLMERLDPNVIGRFVRASGQAQGRLAHTVGWLVRALVAANPREHESN